MAEKDPKETTTKSEEERKSTPEYVEDLDDLEVEDIIPKMEVHPEEMMNSVKPECIVKDDTILGLYDEILENSRQDRNQIDEVLANFIDMVMNDGESSSASKEAIVNLMKIKSDTNDKMAKVADLMTRMKLKERDTFPRYLAAQQNNKVVIENSSKREFLKLIDKAKEKKKNGK